MRSIELFAGAGGLALGVARAGFRHDAVLEWNRNACETIRSNQERGHALVQRWPVHEVDVARFDYSGIQGETDLLGGGPPCQPFSLGGKHRAHKDKRDLFPEVFRAARELRPRAIVVENVKGLLRRSFADYFEYITLQLAYPEFVLRNDEPWQEHRSRLEQHHTRSRHAGELVYNVVYRLVNAADYGVPQVRQRVVIVAFRADLDVEWSFPEPTHSREALLHSQWVTGEYWERHGVSRRKRPEIPARMASRTQNLKRCFASGIAAAPWRTVRDAIDGLPDPRSREAREVSNHVFQPGARSYAGHTGSPLDEPAKTLKAGVHGVPGGENMLADSDGHIRYFTVRESARLQTFPDDYVFVGSWTETMRQLGNAVPVSLADTIARKIKSKLARATRA